MAVTKEQVLASVSEYRSANARPCPARYLTDKFGDDVLSVIDSLKKDGTLVGKRGRTGGLVPSDSTPTATADTDTTAADSSDVTEQFAALAARLAESEPTDAAVG